MERARRDTLRTILTTAGIAVTASLSLVDPEAWERLAIAHTQASALNSETLTQLDTLTTACWQLSNSGELSTAEETLSAFLPRLIKVAPYQSDAAILAARGLQLRSILAAHNLKLADKLVFCQQAVEHARLANDYNTLVVTLAELAVSYKYANQLEESLRTYQEALLYAHHVSPLLCSRIYAATAAAFALCGRKQEAQFYIQLAYSTFPDHPEQDPSFAFADCGIFTIAYYDGLVHIALGDGDGAWHAFDRFKEFQPGVVIPERNRLEIINHKAQAAILSRDLDRYVFSLKEGLAGSVTLKSKKRFDEAVHTYQQMPQAWLNEPRIKEIAEQYYLQKRDA